nr:MAG TPA: hypothetical protein [Caudoviricetes sp.]
MNRFICLSCLLYLSTFVRRKSPLLKGTLYHYRG